MEVKEKRRSLCSIVLFLTIMLTNIFRVEASFARISQRVSRTSTLWDGRNDDDFHEKESVNALLGIAHGRAMRNMATDSKDESSRDELSQSLQVSTNRVLGTAMGRAMRTLSTTFEDDSQAQHVRSGTHLESRESDGDGYLANPAINPTALGHQLWSHILRPNVDTAIDATCGNGNDSVAIASMLFTSFQTDSQLICIDIQEEACETTRDRLVNLLTADILNHHVTILHTSHSPLPHVGNVGLVCYNLGYLPNSNRDVKTQMDTTISSIADAANLLRMGGMLSITTYPRSNANEDYAVHALLEGLALLSSTSIDWRAYVEDLGPDPDNPKEYSVRDTVQTALERIVSNGPRKQTWRVMENKLLGRTLSPILLTATRIQ
jgi:hypothetical protein